MTFVDHHLAMDYTPLSDAEVADDPSLQDWRTGDAALRATFAAGSFTKAGALVAAIAAHADATDHHPDLELRYPDLVVVTLRSHVTGGVTVADAISARAISRLAAERDATAATSPQR